MAEDSEIDDLVEKGVSENRSIKPAVLGSFEDPAGQTNAELVCVLVVHYDFKNSPINKEDFRRGDAEDIANLRKTFKDNRTCNYRELKSPKKNDLLKLLASEDKLLRLFGFHGDASAPSVFILFVLSHGEAEGIICTDHRDEITKDYIKFTTAEVFKSIGKLEKFKRCLKLINLGPHPAKMEESEQIKRNSEDLNSFRLTTYPHMQNLVLFYSTVETTKAVRDDDSVTLLVKEFCKVLKTMKEDTPLANFLTMVQSRIHQSSLEFGGQCTGQTLEFKMFMQDANFVISALPRDKPEWPRHFVKPNLEMKKHTDSFETAERHMSYDELLQEAKNVKEKRVFLLQAEAGFGKTTLLKELANDLEKILPDAKILRIPLTKACFYLSTISTIEQFLVKMTNYTSEEMERILNGGKAIVFLDDYDKIPLRYRSKVLSLAIELTQKTMSLWICSRPQEAGTIETQLKHCADTLNILPLNEDQQIQLMQKLTNKSEDDCRALLASFGNLRLENPLLLTLFYQCKSVGNLYDMCGEVVLQRVRKYIEESVGVERDQPNFKITMEEDMQLLIDFAVKIFKNEANSAITETEEYGKKLNNTGITTVVDGKVTFIHQTFADFLVAQRFLVELKSSGESGIKLIEDSKLGYNECLFFIDSFLSVDEPFTEVDEDSDSKNGTEVHSFLPRSRENVDGINNKLLEYFTKNKDAMYSSMIFKQKLTRIIDLMMSHITFEEDAAKCLLIEDGARLLAAAISNEDIALKLLEMGALSRAEQLVKDSNLSELLRGAAEVNATKFLTALKDKFPNIRQMILSQRERIDAGIVAVEKKHDQILDFLLTNGVDVKFSRNEWKSNALEAVCRNGDIPCMKVLLKHGVDLTKDVFSAYETSALHAAARYGKLPLVEFLVQGGYYPDLTLKDKRERMNALHYAAEEGHVAVVKFLHEQNDKIVHQGSQRGNSLHFAAKGGSLELCRWLVDVGVDVHAVADYLGTTILHEAAQAYGGNLELFEYVLELGIDMQLRADCEMTVLHHACQGGNLQIVQKLLDIGADLSAKDCIGKNAMHFACSGNWLAVAIYLHKKDSNLVKEVTKDGRSVLHLAIESFSFDAVFIYWLVEEAGVDINIISNDGQTALMKACEREKWDAVDILLNRSEIDVKQVFCKRTTALDYELVKKNVLSPGFKDKDGFNVLHLACLNGDLDFAKKAHAQNQDLIKEKTNDGRSALDVACASTSPEKLALIRWLEGQM